MQLTVVELLDFVLKVLDYLDGPPRDEHAMNAYLQFDGLDRMQDKVYGKPADQGEIVT